MSSATPYGFSQVWAAYYGMSLNGTYLLSSPPLMPPRTAVQPQYDQPRMAHRELPLATTGSDVAVAGGSSAMHLTWPPLSSVAFHPMTASQDAQSFTAETTAAAMPAPTTGERRSTGATRSGCEKVQRLDATNVKQPRFDFAHLATAATADNDEKAGDSCNQEARVYSHVTAATEAAAALRPKKDYICKFCSRQFFKSHNLTVHERTHTGERPYTCGVCQKAFRRQDHLRDHSYTHWEKKPYECHICQKGFCQSRSLSKHMELHSPGNMASIAETEAAVAAADGSDGCHRICVGKDEGAEGKLDLLRTAS